MCPEPASQRGGERDLVSGVDVEQIRKTPAGRSIRARDPEALLDSLELELELRPLARGVSYRRATVREVVGVWRRIS